MHCRASAVMHDRVRAVSLHMLALFSPWHHCIKRQSNEGSAFDLRCAVVTAALTGSWVWQVDSAMGAALQAAFMVMTPIGGKLLLFLAAVPSLGKPLPGPCKPQHWMHCCACP